MKILIAEDDKTSRMIVEKAASKWGYEPIVVEDGETAWEVLQQKDPPRLLLLDWEMPKLSGIDLCQRIREQESDDPSFIILLTSRNRTEDIVLGLESGSNEYISKPFNNAELQARLAVGKRMLELQEKRMISELEKSRLRRQLQQARKMEALGQITGGIAHDFNNILGIIMGYTNMAIDRYSDEVPEKMINYLKTSVSSSERAKELVAKLLVFTEGEDKELHRLQLDTQVAETVEQLTSLLPDTLEIKMHLEQDIPRIFLEPTKLQQLLMILCDNAKDAMSAKGVITISVSVTKKLKVECSDCHKLITGDWVELTITDDGSGMTTEVIDHIFEPFYTTKEYGKGMGLAMLHGIMSQSNRHISIESELDKGSTVRLFFPFA